MLLGEPHHSSLLLVFQVSARMLPRTHLHLSFNICVCARMCVYLNDTCHCLKYSFLFGLRPLCLTPLPQFERDFGRMGCLVEVPLPHNGAVLNGVKGGARWMTLAFTSLRTVPGTIRWHSWASPAVYEVLPPRKYIKRALGLAGDNAVP